MGYCMRDEDVEFFLPIEHHKLALQAIKNLAGQETNDDSSGKHFSWVNDFVNLPDIDSMLKEWRWWPHFDGAGNIVDLDFTGEKYGDCSLMFNAIAPYVKPGSYIQMRGEDGAGWRWFFDGKTCSEIAERRSFEP